MHYEEMLTWLLFYTSLLDLAKTPEQDVLDPGGIVKSQVLQSADGALRLVLNASQSSRTQSSRFLSEVFGSGVQHIAFATADIFATVGGPQGQRRRAAGDPRELLRRPRSQDRSVADEIDRLKAHNILYERDGTGEYLQVYTQHLRGALLLRDRRAARRLQGLRRQQRADPPDRAGPRRAPPGYPPQLARLIHQEARRHRVWRSGSGRAESAPAARQDGEKRSAAYG